MADIAFHDFADAFRQRLSGLGYSLRDAERKWPATDRAMLSRAVNGKVLSAGNYLLLCEMAGLDPYLYFERAKRKRTTMKTIVKQMVTRPVSCETAEPS